MELREENALAIATEWARRLHERFPDKLHFDVSENEQGGACTRFCVLLTTDCRSSSNTVTQDEWRLLLETFAVWRALTQCRGIGEAETWWVSARVANELSLGVITCWSNRLSVEGPLRHTSDALQFMVEFNFAEPDDEREDFLTLEDVLTNYAQARRGITREGSGWPVAWTTSISQSPRRTKRKDWSRRPVHTGDIYVDMAVMAREQTTRASSCVTAS